MSLGDQLRRVAPQLGPLPKFVDKHQVLKPDLTTGNATINTGAQQVSVALTLQQQEQFINNQLAIQQAQIRELQVNTGINITIAAIGVLTAVAAGYAAVKGIQGTGSASVL